MPWLYYKISNYVEKYKQSVHDFQTKTMDLILDCLYSRVDTIDQKLVLIKQNLQKNVDFSVIWTRRPGV